MSWVVELMRYHQPVRREVDSLEEAIATAMWGIEDGAFAPTAIRGPEGSLVIDDEGLSRIYSEDFGRISTAEIAARVTVTTSVTVNSSDEADASA